MATLWEVLLAGAGALSAALFLHYRFSRKHRLARRLPGAPFPLPILGDILRIGFSFEDQLLNLIHLWRTHGNILRCWMGPLLAVSISDPRDAEIILSNVKYIEKHFPYNYLYPWLGTGLLTSGGQKWHKRRKLLTPSFHFKILDNFVPIFESQGKQLVENLREVVDQGPVDILPFAELYTQDVICETAMGVRLNAQRKEKSSMEYVASVKDQNDLFMQRIVRPWCIFDSVWKRTSFGKREARNLQVLHGTTIDVIRNRRQRAKEMAESTRGTQDDDLNVKKRLAFLDLLILSSEDGRALSDADIREEVDTFMFEGHDTTASGVAFSLYEVSRHPHVQERVVQELREVMGSELDLRMENLQKLKYLERVLKEALRLWPPVPLTARYLREDVKLVTQDVTLPSGTCVVMAPYALHRHAEFFPDPETFDPDHFLPERCVGRHPYAYIPFSAGPRNCIGQKFALLELKSVVSKVLWHYELLPVPNYAVRVTSGLTLKSSTGVRVMLTERKARASADAGQLTGDAR